VTAFAGNWTASFSGDGGPATAAALNYPSGVAVDSAGNVYIGDTYNYRVRKVSTGGIISTFAGNGAFRYAGDTAAATGAQLSSPYAVVRDAAGNLYIADTYNHRIRKFTVGGAIITIAGTAVQGYSGDNGAATAAMLARPTGVALDGAGNLYIADSYNYRVRKLNLSTGVITTAAGNGNCCYSGDGGPATAAYLYPAAVSVDAGGNLYITDSARIRKVNTSGIISTVAGNGGYGYSGDGGPATAAPLRYPRGVAVDATGNVYIADADNYRVRKVDTGGMITTVAGNGTCCSSGDGGPATAASVYPYGIWVDASGNLYIAADWSRIRKVTPLGIITTVAGTGSSGFSGDGGPAISAQLNSPQGVWVNAAGDLFIADTYNHRIRMVSNSIAVADFSLSLTPPSQSVAAGLAANYTVTVTALNGFSSLVSLSCSGLPAGASCNFSPAALASGNVTLRLSTSTSTPVGSSTITVMGTSGSLIRVATATLTTATAAVPASLTIVSGNNQTGPAGAALPNPLVVKVADSSGNPIAGVTVSFTVPSGAPVGPTTGSLDGTWFFDFDAGIQTSGSTSDVWWEQVDSTVRKLVPVNGAMIVNLGVVDFDSITVAQLRGYAYSTTAINGNNDSTNQLVTGDVFAVATNAGGCAKVKVLSYGYTLQLQWVTYPGVGGTLTPSSAVTDYSGLAQAGWTLSTLGANTATASVSGLSPVSFSATASAAVTGPGITTVAGTTWVFPQTPIAATSAPLGTVQGAATDTTGNVYVADSGNHMVFKISSSGVLNLVAGTGTAGFSGDNGPATAAALSYPSAVAVDAYGNVYIADSSNSRVRKVSASTGIITTVAGTGSGGYSGDGGPAASAQLRYPQGVAVDTAGNLYVADSQNYRVRKVDTSGIITTVAGSGTYGYSGDGGPATAAQLGYLRGIAISTAGYLYITDTWSGYVRKVDPSGTITSVSGLCCNFYGVAVDAGGNLYAAENNQVQKVSTGGTVTTLAGTGTASFSGDSGPAVSAALNYPSGVAVDSAGNVYIADTYNYRVRKVSTGGIISTFAGNGAFRYAGDAGAATGAQLSSPYAVVGDAAGNLYIADTYNHRIRKFTVGGAIITIAGTGAQGYSGDNGTATAATLARPTGVALDGAGNLYITDSYNLRVRRLNLSTGVITTAAGSGNCCYSGDGGPATAAALSYPYGVSLDAGGNLYITDSARIRKVNTSGIITTVAGTGSYYTYSGDGGPATLAGVGYPYGVAVDATGNVYIADTYNDRIRKVDTSGIITTVAGNGTYGSSGDGGPATAASLYPYGVSVDSAGNLYIAGGSRIRKVTPGGIISTVAGTGSYGFSGDGGPAISAQLNSPQGVWVNAAGDLFIADTYNGRIRLVSNSIALPDFSLAITPTSQSVVAGLAANYTVTVTALNGFSSPVSLSCSGLPTGASCNLSPNPAPPGTSALTLSTSVSTPLGTTSFTISGTSGSLIRVASASFAINNPSPVITSINPVERTAGSGAFLLTVSGLNFVTGATVLWNGAPLVTTYVSATALTAQISDALAAIAGVFPITVTNPAPGGGTSAGMPFTVHPAGSYLVGDAAPASGNNSGLFGNELLDNMDLILALRAVTSVPGFLPANCSDLFDAMDSYPVDNATRGGDGMLDNLDLIATLRRVTNADTSRPRRATRGLVCSTMAPGLLAMLARPAELPSGAGAVEFQREQPAADGAARVAVYLAAYRDLDLGGLSLAFGWTDSSLAAQAPLGFVSAAAGAPALLDNRLPGTIAAAWLGGLRLRAGQRLLLGFVHISTSGQQVTLPVLYGAMANDRATGVRIPLELPRRERTKQ
jgi:sugar lactone lactonase YvrE